MARQTSVSAYNTIKNSGVLGKLRWQVYNHLFINGPLTQTETYTALGGIGGHQSIAPRFAELKKFGLITEVGTRKCNVTGVNVIEWDVTSNLPVIPPKKTITQKIQDIDAQIAKLQSKKAILQKKLSASTP